MLARVSAILAFSGITVNWLPFSSSTYPYTIKQPSSYKHVVIYDTSGNPVDYFFPSLGSSITNVNIYCDHGRLNAGAELRSVGAKHVHRAGRILIDGTKRALIRGQFHSVVGYWTEEQIVFSDHGKVWHLTASYASQFRSQRPIMIRMLKSFRPSPMGQRAPRHPRGPHTRTGR
jgi:hypothetical protein